MTKELTKVQFTALAKMIEVGSPLLLCPEPLETDEQEKKLHMAAQQAEMDEPVELKLLEDITVKFEQQLQGMRDAGNRTFKAYSLTEAGLLMFNPNANGGIQ